MKNISRILEAQSAWEFESCPQKEITFQFETPNEIKKVIVDMIQNQSNFLDGKSIDSFRSLKAVDDPSGHYSMGCSNQKWFIRISRHRKYAFLEDEIVEFLKARELNINFPVVRNLNVEWRNHTYLL